MSDHQPTPIRKNSRELSRERKRRQRDRQRERNRLAAEALAARQEAAAEDLAPKILREPIMDGDRMLLGARVTIVNGRPERALLANAHHNPMDNLHHKSPLITDQHQKAARQLQQDWSDVGSGCGVGAMDYLKAGGGGGDGIGGHKAMLAQIEARKRLEGAMTFLGKFQAVVCRVVLDCIPVSVWAAEIDCYPGVVMAWLVKALDQLVLFYFPETPARGTGKLLTFGPSRVSYSTEVGDSVGQ